MLRNVNTVVVCTLVKPSCELFLLLPSIEYTNVIQLVILNDLIYEIIEKNFINGAFNGLIISNVLKYLASICFCKKLPVI